MRTFSFSLIFIKYLLPFFCLAGEPSLFISSSHYNLEQYRTIEQSFLPPRGFVRLKVKENSFAAYLRKLPVIKDSVNVLDFQNHIKVKSTDSTLAGTVPVNIAGKRLWQCMDIIVRLHADYLSHSKNPNIKYPLPDGTLLSLSEWQKGIRPIFKGLHFSKLLKSKTDRSFINFERYLNTIFEYSGTQTFWHNCHNVPLDSVSPGDFIVTKGEKRHAVLIVDLAEDHLGNKVALFGQGDTPACQFYLLKNKNGSPWFKIDKDKSFPDLPIKKRMFWRGLRKFGR